MEFLELIDTIEAEAADTKSLYADAGKSVRGMRSDSPVYKRQLLEAAKLLREARTSDRAAYKVREAMTTSDFPLLFGDILDRQMLAAYNDYPMIWPAIARRATVRDFRQVKRFTLDGGESALSAVPERTEYPAAALSDNSFAYAVSKFGRRLPFTWEDFVNDDLGALENSPARLAKAARVSEERFVTGLFVNQFNTTSGFFRTAGTAPAHGNLVTGNPVLSIGALQTAFTVANAQVDADGNPIYISRWHLMVPPALEVVANNIINASEIIAPVGGGANSGANDVLRVNNWVKNKTDVVVNPWLPILDTTQGNTAWYLFADASESRPTMELGHLRGHETPELFMKAPNATRIGGGTVAATDGDFDTDSVEYKVRHVFGGTLLDYKGAVASKGA